MRNIRRANTHASELIIEVIIAAPRSTSDLLSYAAVFGMSEHEKARPDRQWQDGG